MNRTVGLPDSGARDTAGVDPRYDRESPRGESSSSAGSLLRSVMQLSLLARSKAGQRVAAITRPKSSSVG